MNKIELLAPAGNLLKLKTAIDYGADAVYIGGKAFSLRARANNFTLDDLKEAVLYAHEREKKVYVTMNAVPRNIDFIKNDLNNYLAYLEKIRIDGIICSSMYIALYIKENFKGLDIHLSTQASCLNSKSLEFYSSLGFSRVVLGREANVLDIKNICANTKTEIEVFIHGGMCSSISGRCMLSNYFVNRDANRGGCAHSCRWNYDLFDENHKKLNRHGYLNIASKDLCAINFIKDLMDAGVASLKIEGRMKSEYYIATVVRTYRMLIDALNKNEVIDYKWYHEEMQKAENRLSSHGFLKGKITVNEQLYDSCDHPTKEFIGVVLDKNRDGLIKIEQRNYFKVGDKIEFFGPKTENQVIKVEELYNEKFERINVAPHPKEILYIKSNVKIEFGDMIRLCKHK